MNSQNNYHSLAIRLLAAFLPPWWGWNKQTLLWKERDSVKSLPSHLHFLHFIHYLKFWHLLLISFIHFEIHMTKLLFKSTWINLASINSPSMCWTKSKYISQEDKQPWLLAVKTCDCDLIWGMGRLSIKSYPGFYCYLKTDVFWIAFFFSKDWHCHIFQDEQFSKGAFYFLINVIRILLYPNLLPSWVSFCYIHSVISWKHHVWFM